MKHNMADLIMNKIEKYDQSCFLINNNENVTNYYIEEIKRKEKKRFYGENGYFDTKKMQFTNRCKLENNKIVIMSGGIVYGPYYTFPAGKYKASFHTFGNEKCKFSVENQEKGIIASCVQHAGVVVLYFELERLEKMIEFKVENYGKEDVYFSCVKISADKLDIELEDVNLVDKSTSKELFEINRLEHYAECRMPTDTRFINIKRLILTIIRPFTQFQIIFNKAIARTIYDFQINTKALLDKQDRNDQQITQINQQITQINQQITQLWNKIEQFDNNFLNIWETYGNFRQEVFYELDSRSAIDKKFFIDPIIKESAEEMINKENPIRLNIGSGNISVEGYLSVDARDLDNVDVVADVANLPFENETVDEIFSAHLIEHFTRMKMERELLPYWHSLLKEGGIIRVIFPDLDVMIKDYSQGIMEFDQLAKVIMGGQDYQLDYHYAVYSSETVVAMLEKAGFRDVVIVEHGRVNGECKETEIKARK